MPIASKLSQYIVRKGVQCQPLHHSRAEHFGQAIELANAVPELCLKAVVLIDAKGPVVALLPYLAEPDLDLVNKTLGRQFQFLPVEHANRLFKDCEPGIVPPFAMAYGLPVLVDAEAMEWDHCFVASGCSSTLLKLSGHALGEAIKGAIKVRVSRWPAQKSEPLGIGINAGSGNMSLESVTRKLQKIYKLPPMPETAVRIMHLVADPDSDVFALAQLIERDPSLSAQVMRYARSALFNYRGELSCVKDAVNIVLGFDRVSQLAMGIAASKAFTIPADGPLGLKRFWQHALYCGVLTQALAVLANPELELDDKDAYLAGLLHNFGILLIGHLFPPEFRLLNRLRESEADASMRDIEQQVFGIGSAQEFIALGHGSMGAILLKLWGLPESTVKAAAMHQNDDYQGAASDYVRLVQLANNLLAAWDVGDQPGCEDIDRWCVPLGIDPAQARELAEHTVEQCRSLDALVSDMAA